MISRRNLLKTAGALCAAAIAPGCASQIGQLTESRRKPNLVFVFADQWRAQSLGYAGDVNVHTPVLDELARHSVRFTNAVSTCPVCSPYRGSLITGQYPLTHGVFLNDVHLNNNATSIAQTFSFAGYHTAYIGKWHLNSRGRTSFIPREDRQGFDYWKVLECTHNYNRSAYFGDENVKRFWNGYDAAAQTEDAIDYINHHADGPPFALFLSWGPPHNPYETAPAQYRAMYDPSKLVLRPNIPKNAEAGARKDLAGYYAHCSAMDACIGRLLAALKESQIDQDTIFVFTSDHGDMLGSQGESRKQRPYDESILVPLLIKWPKLGSREIAEPIGAPDLMPTMLGLCGVAIPKTVEGNDWSAIIRGQRTAHDEAALIACYSPFGEWTRARGGREYRGLRARRWTYVRELNGPWLLFDNETDPYQTKNLCGQADYASVQSELEKQLAQKLVQTHDDFLPGADYIRKWGYVTDATGTVPYTD